MRLKLSLVAAALLIFAAGAAHADDIKIGVAGPITGSDAAVGEQMRRGAEMAVRTAALALRLTWH